MRNDPRTTAHLVGRDQSFFSDLVWKAKVTDQKEPREWCINPVDNGCRDLIQGRCTEKDIHVIEYEAYKRLKAQITVMEAQKDFETLANTKSIFNGLGLVEQFKKIEAENEQLKQDNLLALDVAKRFADERDELKAENARLKTENDRYVAACFRFDSLARNADVKNFTLIQKLTKARQALEEAKTHFNSIMSGLTTNINKVEQLTKSLAHDAYVQVFNALKELGDGE